MSDEAKEAALNAKIEAIRAKNAAREARHREIEADRLEAEKSKSAVSVKAPGEEETNEFKNPYENAATNRKKPVHERISNAQWIHLVRFIRATAGKQRNKELILLFV